MACLINRTKDGKINKVTTPTGQESKLFNAIHGNVFLADAETSVKILNNAYSEKVEKVFDNKSLLESKVDKAFEEDPALLEKVTSQLGLVHHSTSSDTNAFSFSKAPKVKKFDRYSANWSSSIQGFGFFFSESKDNSMTYTDRRVRPDGTGTTVSAFYKSDNPYIVSNPVDLSNKADEYYNTLVTDSKGVNVRKSEEAFASNLSDEYLEEIVDENTGEIYRVPNKAGKNKIFKDSLVELGYDSIQFMEGPSATPNKNKAKVVVPIKGSPIVLFEQESSIGDTLMGNPSIKSRGIIEAYEYFKLNGVSNSLTTLVDSLNTEDSKGYTYDTGEPKLFYQSATGKEYDNLEELLINEDFGQVQMGFKNPKNDEFMPIAKFTTKGSEKNEFLHAKVREGLLSADRKLGEDGITRFQGKGEFTTTRVVTAIKVADDLAAETGNGRVTVLDDGTIEMEFANGYSEVIKPNGSTEVIRTENIPEYLAENPDVENATDLMIEYTVIHDNPRPIDREVKKPTAKVTNVSAIEKSLYGFLESLGFSVTTLQKYRKNYNTKYGKDPDISALADITNRIVAFNEGEIDISDLSEEVAHIAIEAYSDQASIEEALRNVHLTPEYEEFYEFYKTKYAPFFKGEQLERQVKKEILGKILKREFLTRFDQSYKNESQSWLGEQLRNIWEWFTNLVGRNQMGHHRRSLDRLNQKIADSVLNQTSEDFQTEFDDEVNFFYNAMDNKARSIEEELLASKRIVEDLYSKALDTPVNQAELDRLSQNGGFLDILSSVNTIVGIAENQLNVLMSNVQDATNRGDIISATDQNRYEVLKENMLPTIENIISELPRKAEQLGISDANTLERMQNILDISENLPVKMSRISPLINRDKAAWVDKMLLRILDRFSLNEEQKAEVVKSLDGGMKDIGWIGKTFGLSSHSKNLAIQLMHYAVTNIGARVNREFNNIFNKEIKDITDKGLQKYQRNLIYRDENGNVTHYFLSPRDYHRYDTELRAEENRIISELTDFSEEEVEKKRSSMTIPEIINDDAKYIDYRESVRAWKDEVGLERRFSSEYYEQRDARFDAANVSKETRDYLSRKNVGRLSRRKKYMQPDGTIDLSKQTEAEKIEDRNDFKQHLLVKSAYDSSGNIKGGLRRVLVSDLTAEERASLPFELDPDYTGEVTLLEKGQDLETLPGESRMALDLFNLDMVYRQELKNQSRTNTPIEKFFDTIKEIEDGGDVAYEWLVSNATLGLSSSFYEGMGTSETYMERAQEYVSNIEDAEDQFLKQALLEDLKKAQSKRKELLKQNRRSDSTIETDVKHMTTQARKALLELDEEISEIRIALAVPFEQSEEDADVIAYFEQGLNEDYQKMLTESGKDEYTFALENMSRRNRVRTERFAQQVTDFVKGRKSYLDRSFDEFVNEMFDRGMIPEDASTDEIIRILKDEYAKKNLASYFRRFQPMGYTQMLNDIKDGKLKISDILDPQKRTELEAQYPALEYLEISPEYSWSEDVNNEENINPNFKTKGQVRQPKFLNKEFFNRYGIKEQDYLALEDEDISKLKPTKNQEEFELLVKVTNLRQMSLENNGDQATGNKYMRPQVSKSNFEKISSIHRGAGTNIKDFFTDMVKSKIDEKEYGEELEDTGINIKLIPKYYQDRLESADLVTENVLEAAMIDLKASLRYKERVKAERDIKAIEYKISQQKFKNGGGKGIRSRILKKGEVSGYYEKAQEMADYHLYGIRQNRQFKIPTPWGGEIDVVQLFSSLTKLVRNLNLGFNFITDLTSYTTGVYNNAVDAASGDYYHKSSVIKATKQLPGMIVRYLGESGAMAKRTELAHLTEFFGIIDPLDRVEESLRNRIIRSGSKSMYFASKLANLPVTPKNMLALLYDFKFYNGRFVDYNNFSRLMRMEKENISQKEIDALWKANEDTIYSNLTIDPDTGVSYNEKFEEKFGDKSNEEFDLIHEQLTAKMTQINQSVDAIISEADQIAGQRDALVNATMMHRGWFIINMTRKFKGKHFNIATGQIEEGHYMTIFKTLSRLRKGGWKGLVGASEEHEIRNLKRLGFDTVAAGLVIAIANMLMAGDDEDDTYIENLAQLIALRTTNESLSQTMLGMPGSIEEIYTNPVMQFGNIKDLAVGIYNYDDEAKRKRALKQFLPYRRYNQLADLDKQISAYLHFNGPTNPDSNFPTLMFISAANEEK